VRRQYLDTLSAGFDGASICPYPISARVAESLWVGSEITVNIFWTCLESMTHIIGDPPKSDAIEQLQRELREMSTQERAQVANQFNILATGISRLTTIDTVSALMGSGEDRRSAEPGHRSSESGVRR
jgi:hypothetical protein